MYALYGKRIFDVAAASAILVVISPILAVTWVVLRLSLGRDVVISQERVGYRGETFEMLKFRTMRWSRRRADREAGYNGEDRRRTHKSDNDPRHTPIGRVLRKTSIDELPQLFNVLNGTMSLVGPRPEMAQVVDRLDARDHPRHTVRPGLTGEWQITERQSGAPLFENFDCDLPYLDRVTFRNDLRILAGTFAVVFGAKGR
jgi:lipopolysaccharide/colanic/teichoic acid biosynthesis glycosyltransferase